MSFRSEVRHANGDLEVTLDRLAHKPILKEVTEGGASAHAEAQTQWGLRGRAGGTLARVLRDALTPSSMTFTACDSGFWAPSSILVSIPKAACGRESRGQTWRHEGGTEPHTGGWTPGPCSMSPLPDSVPGRVLNLYLVQCCFSLSYSLPWGCTSTPQCSVPDSLAASRQALCYLITKSIVTGPARSLSSVEENKVRRASENIRSSLDQLKPVPVPLRVHFWSQSQNPNLKLAHF